ncbi:hypothetical protein OB236_23775 [Paenibacillus sp. WQ 127069]|uniref:RHS repeat protein n=1 Tax=Paenibacillus baimaensis TaxID=2982185 RepID=A0ABT2UM88_9BACL|nr:hypothetical protein [Paenibacillus sp. WQ 127069]MCU6795131.1 hypothetical protein [Paenibacillus sp. WQ 127069]
MFRGRKTRKLTIMMMLFALILPMLIAGNVEEQSAKIASEYTQASVESAISRPLEPYVPLDWDTNSIVSTEVFGQNEVSQEHGYRYVYDKQGRLDYIKLPSGDVTDVQYDPNGNQTKRLLSFRSLVGDRESGSILNHTSGGDSSSFHSDTIVNYKSWDGSNWTVKMVGGNFIHAPNGDFTNTHISKNIDYVTWDGENGL